MSLSNLIRRYFYLNYIRLEKFRFWFKHRFTLKGWFIFWSMLLVMLPGMSTRLSMAYQLLAMGLCFFIVAVFSLRRFKPKLVFKRQLPEITRVGQELSYVLRVENTTDKTFDGILIQDCLQLKFPDEQKFLEGKKTDRRNVVDRFLGYPRFQSMMQNARAGDIKELESVALPAHSVQHFELKARFNHRGHHTFYGFKVMKEESLGLMRSNATFESPGQIWVFPALWKNLNWKPGWLMDMDSETNMTKQKKGDPEILHYLREYQQGDSPKYIHWKSSAKLDRFVVKNFLQEKGEAYGLILDAYYGHENKDRWEALLSWLSTCLNDQLGSQLEIQILIFGDHISEMKFDGSLSSWKTIMKILSTLEPDSTKQKLGSASRLLKACRSKRAWTWLGVDHTEVEFELWQQFQAKGIRLQGTFIANPDEVCEQIPCLVESIFYEPGQSNPMNRKVRA